MPKKKVQTKPDIKTLLILTALNNQTEQLRQIKEVLSAEKLDWAKIGERAFGCLKAVVMTIDGAGHILRHPEMDSGRKHEYIHQLADRIHGVLWDA